MGSLIVKKIKENKIQLLSFIAIITYLFSLLVIIKSTGYLKILAFCVNPIFIFPAAFLLFKKNNTIFSFTLLICALLTIFFPLEYFVRDNIWRTIIIAPITEEALKFSVSFLCAFLVLERFKINKLFSFKTKFNIMFIIFSILLALYFGIVEYTGKEGSLWNIITHLSFTLLGTIIMASYFQLLQSPEKKRLPDYSSFLSVMPFFIISLIIILHSISNMIANDWGLGKIIISQFNYIINLFYLVLGLAFLILSIILIKLILKSIYRFFIKIGLRAEKNRTAIGIACLSFFVLLILNVIDEGVNLVLVLLIFLIVPLGLSFFLSYKYHKFTWRYIRERFRYPKIAILDGRITEKKYKKLPEKTVFKPKEWEKILREKNLNVELIPVSKISDEYPMIINPFGATYIEEDLTNLKTLKKIKDYIINGGTFVNSNDLAFWHSWDSENVKQELTSPGIETYGFDLNRFLEEEYEVECKALKAKYEYLETKKEADLRALETKHNALKAKCKSIKDYIENRSRITLNPMINVFRGSLIDTWLYKNFGIRTTLGSKRSLKAIPKLNFLKNIGKTKINEYRAALRCERDDSTFIGLISAEYEKNYECYPVAAVYQGFGYIILFGIALDSENKPELEFECLVISLLYDKLAKDGSLK